MWLRAASVFRPGTPWSAMLLAAAVAVLSTACYGSSSVGADESDAVETDGGGVDDRTDEPRDLGVEDSAGDLDAVTSSEGGPDETGAVDGGADVPTACPYRPPPPDCTGAACAASDRAAHYLDLWWQVMIETLDAPEDLVRSTIEVIEAVVREGPSAVFFQVNYYVHVDWVRARRNSTINLGDYPLDPYPDDAEVVRRLRMLGGTNCPHLPRRTIPPEEVAALGLSCHVAVDPSHCRLRALDPPHCDFVALLFGTIDSAANRCVDATIDIESGLVVRCAETPCSVSAE